MTVWHCTNNFSVYIGAYEVVRRQERGVSRRRMSLGADMSRDRLSMSMSEEPAASSGRMFDALPRLLSRLVARFTRSLVFIVPPSTESSSMDDELSSISNSSSAMQCVSLDDEVD